MKTSLPFVGRSSVERRRTERRRLHVPARLIWRDARGTIRIASVVIANASEEGVLVETLKGSAIPLFRLVDVHVERADRHRPDLPDSLRRAQVLAAVYRVGPYSPVTGAPEYYALRLLVKPEPRRSRPTEPYSVPTGASAHREPCQSLTA
jgi:hypothetical protein